MKPTLNDEIELDFNILNRKKLIKFHSDSKYYEIIQSRL